MNDQNVVHTKPLSKLEEKLIEVRRLSAEGQPAEIHVTASLPKVVATAIERVEHSMRDHQSDPDAVIVPVDQIGVRSQARKRFEDIEELALSIQEQGLLQPIVVRQLGAARFLLLAGERRLRAVRDVLKQATIPARLIVNVEDGQRWRVSQLSENLQRADYAPLELAREFKALKDEFNLSHTQLAATLRVNPSWVWKQLSLLDAPPEIQVAIEQGQIATTDYLNNKAHYLTQVNDDGSHSPSSTTTTPGSVNKPMKRDAVVALPMKTAIELAEILKHLTAQFQLCPVTLGSKPSKKELIAILTTRATDIKKRL